jgi:hypothetical protein
MECAQHELEALLVPVLDNIPAMPTLLVPNVKCEDVTCPPPLRQREAGGGGGGGGWGDLSEFSNPVLLEHQQPAVLASLHRSSASFGMGSKHQKETGQGTC